MKEEKKDVGDMAEKELEKPYRFWIWAMASAILRLSSSFFRKISTYAPVRRSPTLSQAFAALLKVTMVEAVIDVTTRRINVSWLSIATLLSQSAHKSKLDDAGLKGNRVIICADIFSAMLLRATGQKLQTSYRRNLRLLGVLRSIGHHRTEGSSLVEILLPLYTCGILSQYFPVLGYQLLQ